MQNFYKRLFCRTPANEYKFEMICVASCDFINVMCPYGVSVSDELINANVMKCEFVTVFLILLFKYSKVTVILTKNNGNIQLNAYFKGRY